MVYTASQAIAGPGFLLDYEDPAADWVHVGEVKNIDGPTESTEEIDVTNQDSIGGFREFVAGLQDGGTVTFPVHLIPGDAGQQALSDLKHDRTTVPWRIRIPSTPVTAVYFAGFINNLGHEFPFDGVALRNLGIRVSGPVTEPTGYLGS